MQLTEEVQREDWIASQAVEQGGCAPGAGQQRHLLSNWAPGFCVARGCTGSGECVLGQVFQAEAQWGRDLRRSPQVSAPGWLHPSTITTTALLANGKGPSCIPQGMAR